MPLTIVRQEAANRFREAQSFLSEIKEQEGTAPSATSELNVRKGLFLVLLYGAFEYSLTRAVSEVNVSINDFEVQFVHLHDHLYSLALDPELTSIASSGRKKMWQCRAELFTRQSCVEPVVINDAPIANELQNAWTAAIEKTFKIFGVSSPALFDPKVRQYIDELVEKRNAVAHGRESAAVVGQGYTTSRLQNLTDQINSQTQYFFSVFEDYISGKEFVKPRHRSSYSHAGQ